MSDATEDVPAIASQLVAFYREPATWRPRYISGQEPMPQGQVVLKLALGRYPPTWLRHLSDADREELVAAARAFVRQVCLRERATHYQVLCLDTDASRAALRENYRLLMALLHPDRVDVEHEWPATGAQRVNEAYALLSEDEQRHAYDQEMGAPAGVTFESLGARPPPPSGASSHRVGPRHFARLGMVIAIGAAVFALQAWWVSTVPSHYTLLEHAKNSMRDALPSGGLPRFMIRKPTLEFDPIERIESTSMPPALPATSVGSATAVPAVVTEVVTLPLAPRPVPSEPPVNALPVMTEPAPLRMAQATIAPAAAASAPATYPGGPTSQDMENVVARLVSYYESGDVEGLMALFDPEELGFWQGLRVRGAYTDFFRSTRQRRLRMDRLQWAAAATAVKAQGDATMVAELNDGAKLERRIDVAFEVRTRDGQPRIARLVLYPDTR